MRPNAPWIPFALAAVAGACSAVSPSSTPAAAGALPHPSSAGATDGKIGVMAPAQATAIAMWPESFAGSFVLLDVQPSGASVNAGDVVARFDTRSIDDEFHDNELEARSAAVRQRATVEKNRLEDESARSALEQARAGLDRAKRALEGFKSREIAFAHRSDELIKAHEEARLEDQLEELSQDEKMYGEDEQVNATEEIVLRRQRRAVALTKTSNALSRDRVAHHVEHEEKLQLEAREEAVRVQGEAFERLAKSQEIDRRSREDAEARAADALAKQVVKLERLKRDRALFELRAPRAGVLLYGSLKDYRPGKTAPRWERGNQLPARADVFLVADPAESAVAFDLDDEERSSWKDGSAILVRAIAFGAPERAGTLDQGSLQERQASDKNVHEATVRVSGDEACFGRRVRVLLDDGKRKKGARE